MLKSFRWVLLIGGIFSVLVGLYLFFRPLTSLASLTFILSIILLVNGIAEIIRYFSEEENRNGIMLLNGIVTVILAICLMSSNQLGLASFIPYMIAFWVLVFGFTRLFLSFSIRKTDKSSGNYLLMVGILGIIVGLIMMGHPLFTGLMIAYIIGAGFVYQGISNFVVYHKLGKTQS